MAVGIGVIGVGVRGQHSYEQVLCGRQDCVMRAVSQYPGVSAAMLEGRDPAAHARQYASDHGAEYCDNYRDVLARDDVDIVSLMCEPAAAPDLVEACCAAGKHIVRDKPICLDLAGAERIVRAVEGSGSEMLVTLGTRYAPALLTAWERVRSGEIGEVLTATFTFIQSGGPLAGFTASEGYMAAVGGGELTNFGTYAIDYLRWLVGSEVASVYSTVGSHFYPDYQDAGMEDMGAITMRFESGVVGTMVTGRTTTQHKPDSYFRLDITGTRGTVSCNAPEEQILVSNGLPQPVSFSAASTRAMIDDFVEGLAQGRPSPITVRDGAAVLRVLKAAYLSAHEGRQVRLVELGG